MKSVVTEGKWKASNNRFTNNKTRTEYWHTKYSYHKTNVLLNTFPLLHPTGYVMHQQV